MSSGFQYKPFSPGSIPWDCYLLMNHQVNELYIATGKRVKDKQELIKIFHFCKYVDDAGPNGAATCKHECGEVKNKIPIVA